MQPELEHDQVGRAQSRFARARVRYSQIEPAAEEFPRLDERINGLPGEGADGNLTGFHRIEEVLWRSESTAGLPSVGKRLIADAKQLEKRLATARPDAVQLAAGAERILSQVLTLKLTGREDKLASSLPLVDVSANLEAVGAELAALQPALTDEEQARLSRLLHNAYAAISKYGTPARDPNQPRGRSPGAIFDVFTELSPTEVEELDQTVKALHAAVSEVHTRLQERA